MKQYSISKLSVSIFASLYFLYCASDPSQWHFIDNVNLLIHEAGHIVFLPFGEYMHVLGGSLLQVLLPVLFVLYFCFQKQFYSAALTLFWVGENLLNVSNYAGDSLRMQLPLLFGDNSIHDWNWILVTTGELRHTYGIALSIRAAGTIIIIVAAAWSVLSAKKEPSEDFSATI